MSRRNSGSPVSARRDTSTIRLQTASLHSSTSHHPSLGGVAAVSLFIVILIAFVVQSAVTQHVQTTLHFRRPFLLFYIGHSSFSLIFPLHVAYLSCTTSHTPKYYFRLAMATLRSHFSIPSSSSNPLLHKRILGTLFILTIGMSLPGLLWYIAVTLAPISDVTALWNCSAFWAYLLSVYFLHPQGAPAHSGQSASSIEQRQAWWKRLEPRKLLAVAMACIGVAVVVYSGTDDTKAPEERFQRKPAEIPSAPLAGDLLTLLASVIYATVQVLYKKYISLPNEPTEADAVSSPLETYRPIAITEDVEGAVPVPTQDEEDELSLIEETLGPAPERAEALPFGLYPNFITSLVGVTTILIAWPLPLFLSTPSTQSMTDAPSPSLQITLSIMAIALSGLAWNAGYLVLLGIWGPVITSVGNLLTIVLMLIVESIFVESAPTPNLAGVIGCGMIAGGFAVLVWEVVGPGRRTSN
ncbi:hypothetical protein M408DRAFT_69793 [Serendipita vermifera MAFF 305830]|uniref:EamA domain-containing protein n=1 Tax=Serendipita vermifera MAFF 305830 TaxID=933852 RepID=A0A0C3BAC6_SERVB|nr:hypothetical protein M408DRAFT_69793 [Serendipita vermifera MAFF 305830]